MKLDRFVVAATAGAALLCATMAGVTPSLAAPFAGNGVHTMGSGSGLIRIGHHHHHGNGAAAAAGAAAGAAVVLGALAASQANAGETYYAPLPPPPPSSVTYNGRGMDETADDALHACRHGILNAARRYGALDARIGAVEMVRETPDGGHDVRAEITVYYPDYERTAAVTCRTRDGTLLSARGER